MTKEEYLSEEVEKILDDIDSGKVKMVTYESANEFIKAMKKELEKEQ